MYVYEPITQIVNTIYSNGSELREAIHKLANTEIIALTAHLYYSIYLIKKVQYECGVMSLNLNQEQLLKRTYEPVILRKLKLSESFPRKVLYIRNSALRVGLIALRTIVDVLALKLCVGYQRARSKVAKMIQINKDNPRMSYGYQKA